MSCFLLVVFFCQPLPICLGCLFLGRLDLPVFGVGVVFRKRRKVQGIKMGSGDSDAATEGRVPVLVS